ncbi:hypothetical protein V2T39_07085 [Streptococcus agalactiae]
MLFKRKRKEQTETIEPIVLGDILGIGFPRWSDINDIYQKYTPEQLEELSAALAVTLRFVEYQKSLSHAFHEGSDRDLRYLLENRILGNLSDLKKDEVWTLKIGNQLYKPGVKVSDF